LKKCGRCKKELPEKKFYKNRSKHDGLQSYCIDCEFYYDKKYHGKQRKNDSRIRDELSRKRCSRCKQWKPETEFYENGVAKDKKNSQCKNCVLQQTAEYQKTNGKKIHELATQRYAKSEKGKKTQRKMYEREKKNGYPNIYKYQKKHPEKQKKFQKNWRKNHRQYNRIYLAKRRQKLGYFELWSNPFPEEMPVEYHHINNILVIPLPKKTHRRGCNDTERHRGRCKEMIERIYCIDLEKILCP
jgi:hypothetical protein